MSKEKKKDSQWWTVSWNPISGCSPCSIGCKFCWAKAMADRFNGGDFSVKLHLERLDIPLHWRKEHRIFVCSISDLFHPKVPFVFIEKVMATIEECPQHTFQILTKRPHIMLEYFNGLGKRYELSNCPNLHLGVSISNQEEADEKIPILLQIPAAVRWLSIEPMLEEIDLKFGKKYYCLECNDFKNTPYCGKHKIVLSRKTPLSWVVVGCESGPKRRPFKLEWVKSIVDQCKAAGVRVFVKQLSINGKVNHNPEEWPEWARIREYPSA